MSKCRCLNMLLEKGYVDGECFIPCESYLSEKRKLEDAEEQRVLDETEEELTDNDLKIQALEKIKKLYPETYMNRTDYKIIKHNLNE